MEAYTGYRKVSAAEQVYYIIKYKAAEATASLRLRLKLWFTKKPDCKRCCLQCDYYEMCACDYLSIEVEHKGYTVVQSGLNNHISIYDAEGRAVYHAQQSKRRNEQALRETVDFYLYMREEAGK